MRNKSIVVAVVMLALWFIPLVPILAIKDQDTGKILTAVFTQNNTFSLEWIHSVELEPWQETYRLADGKIKLTETRFKAFGAGSPVNEGDEIFFKDGWIVIRGINRELDFLPLTISPRSGHRLDTGRKVLLLQDVAPGDRNLIIEQVKVNLPRAVYYRIFIAGVTYWCQAPMPVSGTNK
ncbi:DUF1850 domain-containing protein [Metallumcola ferriviriculae]|uniref:DUF1850 domain-containing protein n=1 Tax=Metallumcola ferriviriculae TaxID=3039180 RepID=A0AAU0UR00_9FIRM|nr:DUF1850 domain-containing protein [Desulfitibacteraceae bacterium MK1]